MLELLLVVLVVYFIYFGYNMLVVVPKYGSCLFGIPNTKFVWVISKYPIEEDEY